MNLLDFTVIDEKNENLIGIQIMNKNCYVPSLIGDEPLVRRSLELRHQIMEDMFGFTIVLIDPDQENKLEYLTEVIGDITETPKEEQNAEGSPSRGRRIKNRRK